MNDVKVTVLMPAYNAGPFIAEAINSVLHQSFDAFELLIIDDGSTDDTATIVRSFGDKRIRFYQQKNKGVAAALNAGLNYANGFYTARFDADDICFPQRLLQQYNYMKEHPDCVVSGSAADYIDASGNYVFTHFMEAGTDHELKNLPYQSCPFIHASVMYKTDVVKAIGYNENAHTFEDHLLWQQLKPYGKFFNIPYPLLSVRFNPGSVTMDEKKRPKLFQVIKNKALQQGFISTNDGNTLLEIIAAQNKSKGKEGAYHSLLAKKFLWNNYDPLKARFHLKKAISLNDFDLIDYALWGLSYLPKQIVTKIYSTFNYK